MDYMNIRKICQMERYTYFYMVYARVCRMCPFTENLKSMSSTVADMLCFSNEPVGLD